MTFTSNFLQHIKATISKLEINNIEKSVHILSKLHNGNGRLFIIGVGGSAGNASHAVNDFRKLCNIEAYSPVDNISEITAKTNDDGFETIFDSYLKLSRLSSKDVLMVFSVGGGNKKKKISVNIINAIKFAKKKKCKIISIVGKSDGYAYKNSNVSIHIKVEKKDMVTPISETFQALIWHLLVTHPKLKKNSTTW